MAKRWKALLGCEVGVLLFLLLLAPLPITRADSPKAAEPPKTFDLAAIDAYVAAQVRDQGYAGLSLAIMREGKVVLAKGYGKRLLEGGSVGRAGHPVRRWLRDQAVHLRLRPVAGRGREAVRR